MGFEFKRKKKQMNFDITNKDKAFNLKTNYTQNYNYKNMTV